jgi:hypothetical protein
MVRHRHRPQLGLQPGLQNGAALAGPGTQAIAMTRIGNGAQRAALFHFHFVLVMFSSAR